MVNTQLLDYVKQQLAQGSSKDKIIHDLSVAGGWTPADITEAFSALGISQSVPANPANPIPVSPVSSASIANPLSPASPMVVSTEALAAPATVKYAGFWIRWVAVMVDGLILSIPIAAAQYLTSVILFGGQFSFTNTSPTAPFVSILIYWIYFSWMTYAKGATLGKMFVGITVRSEDMQRLSLGRVLVRETIGKIISGAIIMIGYIIAGFTTKKQALHDKFARSVVIYKDPSEHHTGRIVVAVIVACVLPIVAIFGILASVVLVSLNTARHLGSDAQMKSALNGMQVEAEIYFGQNNMSYSVAESCSSGMFADPTFTSLMSSLKSVPVVPTCLANGTSYAISSPSVAGGQNYCVDSTGYAGSGTAVSDGPKASCLKNQIDTGIPSPVTTYVIPANSTSTLNSSTTVSKSKAAVASGDTLVSSTTQTTSNDLWSTFDKVNLALKNKDIASYNKYSYKQVTPDETLMFGAMASFLYGQTSKIDKDAYVNLWKDSKQAIYSTNPVKTDDANIYGYAQGVISFINEGGSWKVLTVNPMLGWSVSKKGTNKTAAEVEQDLRAMMIDSDKDGLTDMDEVCGGAEKYNSKCVKTDPNKRDTNGNGLWDGIEADMK